LATIVETSEDAIVGKDLNGIITDWNRGAERLFGYTAQEAIGQSVTVLIPPDRTNEEPGILARIRRGESVEHYETVRRRKDGTLMDISLTVSPITDAKGRVIGASKIARDITERRQASEALRRALQFDEAIMRDMGEGLFTVDSEGRVTSMNPAAEKLLGWTLYELHGKKMHEMTHFKHRDGSPFPEKDCPSIRVLRDGKTVSAMEDSFIRKDGTFFDVVYSTSPILDGDQTTGLVVVFRDVTERKRAESALREVRKRLANQAAQLERLVQERTAELAASNKQLETFVYTIAHDLRAPLRAMQGFAEMLIEEAGASLSETGRGFIERIGKSARFMDSLLVDLLAFSRIGQERMEMVPVELERVVEGVVGRLENEAKEKNARIVALGPWPAVLAHAPALGEVLINLVTNSLKFVAPDVTPVVLLRAEEEGGWVRVWVEDNGIGIAPEYHEQVFRVFNRLNGEKYPGTGMGLAIVQRAIERMGGRAGLESNSEQGSRFWIELRKA
jgi:PAS domain S-box-containing protein